jgi:integral membrane protein (TIGR01906 family)
MLLTASLAWGFNSLWLYKYGFQKYQVSQSTGLPDSELDKAASGLILYFNSSDEYVNITVTSNNQSFPLFTEEEQIHFKDVKGLVWLDYWVLIGTGVFVLGYIFTLAFLQGGIFRRYLARSVVWGSGLAIFLILALGIASFFDFDALFLQFHFLAFSNQYWSAQGYMLMLFPGGFWYDAAFFCIGFMAALAVILGAAAIFYLLRTKKSSPASIDRTSDN